LPYPAETASCQISENYARKQGRKNQGNVGVAVPKKVISAAKGNTTPVGMMRKETVLLSHGR
jgi:hypothetical protein